MRNSVAIVPLQRALISAPGDWRMDDEKMIGTTPAASTAVAEQSEQTLSATMHSLAGRAPINLLVMLVTSGLVIGCAIAVYRPQLWIVGLLGALLASCGLWGIAERAIGEYGSYHRSSRYAYWVYLVLRWYALITAVGAGILFLVFAFHVFVRGIGVGGG